jgi:hypothetical protein
VSGLALGRLGIPAPASFRIILAGDFPERREHFALISMNDLLDVIALPDVEARWVPVEESPKRYDASCFCADSGTTSKLKDGCHQFRRS